METAIDPYLQWHWWPSPRKGYPGSLTLITLPLGLSAPNVPCKEQVPLCTQILTAHKTHITTTASLIAEENKRFGTNHVSYWASAKCHACL